MICVPVVASAFVGQVFKRKVHRSHTHRQPFRRRSTDRCWRSASFVVLWFSYQSWEVKRIKKLI